MNKYTQISIWIILATWLVTNCYASQREEAGWINKFDGQIDHYTLKQNGKTVPLTKKITTLYVGDQIIVNSNKHSIELMLQGGNKKVVVTHNNSPFVILQEGKVPNSLINLFRLVNKYSKYMFSLIQSDDPHIPTVPNKDNEKQTMTIPWLNSETRLIAGNRSLFLKWYNGEPPFNVQVTHTPLWLETRVVLWEGNVEKTSWIKTTNINFEAKKDYRVTVKDAKGQEITRGFKAVAKAPNYPQELENLDGRHLLQAAWLMDQEDKWKFEALQQLNYWK